MLGTLFNVKVNWGLYGLVLLGIFVLSTDISLYRFIAYAVALHQFMLLFYSFNHILPIRYFAGALAALQYLVGPANAYGGLDEQMYFKYQMQVPEDVYFSYAIPATILFIIGLHIFNKPSGEVISRARLKRFIDQRPRMPYIFIIIGFFASVASGFFPASLANVFYILGGFKFIGLFMLLLGSRRQHTWVLILVIGSIVLSSLRTAMFHDLLTWSFFLLAVLAIKYKPSVIVKLGVGIALVAGVSILQQLKSVYRSNISYGEGGVEAFQESLEQVQEQNGGFFDASSTAQSNTRINQGFIVTYAMNHIPAEEPFANGEELWKILEAAFLPRIIAPNKLKAGDNDFLYQYTGIALSKGTSMSISALGDGYVNFGKFGGSIFMFFWGLSFSLVLRMIEKWNVKYPIAILFAPLIFYYPIRPDTALQTSLGHMVKSVFLIWVVLQIWASSFRLATLARAENKPKPEAEPVLANNNRND